MPSLRASPAGHRGLRGKHHRGSRQRLAEGGEHRLVMHRLRRRDRGVGIAHRSRHDRAALDDAIGLDAEECRRPQHEVGELALFHRADQFRDAVRDRGVDGVFGDVALDAKIVVVALVLRQRAALLLHLVGGLPGADDDFAEPAHGLRIRGHHRQRAEVVQDILRRDGFFADAAFGEGEILGDRGIEMVAHHQHVQMLVDGVAGERPRRIGRGRQHVLQPGNLDDVRRVAAAGAFGVEGVDGAALERLHGVLDEAASRSAYRSGSSPGRRNRRRR